MTDTTQQSKFGFTVGDAVTVKLSVGDAPNECSPGGCYASPGEKLIVRGFSKYEGVAYPVHVSHEHITDRTFGVEPHEIERLS